MTTLIRGGLVHDAVHRDACISPISCWPTAKFAAIGTDLTAPADAAVFDADGLEVYPGFVDAHTHIGLDGYGIGYEGCDYNEMNDIWTPQLRAIDGINPVTPRWPTRARQASPASAPARAAPTCWAAPSLAMKTVGERIDNMIVQATLLP